MTAAGDRFACGHPAARKAVAIIRKLFLEKALRRIAGVFRRPGSGLSRGFRDGSVILPAVRLTGRSTRVF